MSDKHVTICTAVVMLAITLVIAIISTALYLSADHRRGLLRDCLKTERNAQDCRNAVYGPRG